ncbi:VirD4-like conjugal transfer protein, CD1115 family [Gottfriedia sp. NPDC056225]|uniref:VirD4-like conjugal transfer protein, CD1115 family n=1 Tax=Gottfriedia sp. NPDC056225 TaxID=3345751 RepID=UPI0035D5E8FB
MLKYFEKKNTLIGIWIGTCLIVLFLSTMVGNAVVSLLQSLTDFGHPHTPHLEVKDFFLFQLNIFFYLLLMCLAIFCASIVVYKIRSNFASLEKGQKGTSRFTTLDELQKQYRAVPEKEEKFPGIGGIPVSRYQDKIFIDDSPVNNLIIGTTRSGKGETFVFSTIDLYSRAEKQASMILNDPKGELFAASKDTLEKRGYHVEVLNLLDPLQSMSYQILQLVIKHYKQGNYAQAQQSANTVSFMLFNDPNSKDPFWQNSSISLCNALILAICDKCTKEGREDQITMYSVANMLNTLGSKTIKYNDGSEDNALDLYFRNLPDDSAAKMQYATSNFTSGNTRGGIFSNTSSKLSIFTIDNVAKMTSKSSFDLKKVGFGRAVVGTSKPLTRINMEFPNGEIESIRTDANGNFELNYTNTIENGETIVFREKEKDRSLDVMVTSIDKEGVVEFTCEGASEVIRIQKIDSYQKPIAVFMITPDSDPSLHVIASLFVAQLYTELSINASVTKGGKCLREVVFILDEFGNMPTIPNMDTNLTVCLGRGIRFNLIIQAYSQLKTKYGDASETIDGNCNNTIYILTTDETTAERISKKLGERTITTKSRSGHTLSLDKSKTESVDGRRLLTSVELMQLQEAETVIIRIIKRQDLDRKRITPYPIFNSKETAMKYRWEYLSEDFDTDKSINDIDIRCLHADVNLKKLIINFNGSNRNPVEEVFQSLDEKLGQYVKSNQEEPHQPDTSDPEEPKLTDWQKMDIQTFFKGDSLISFIEKHESDIRTMNILDFNDLLVNLRETNQIKMNIYTAVIDKYKALINEYENS